MCVWGALWRCPCARSKEVATQGEYLSPHLIAFFAVCQWQMTGTSTDKSSKTQKLRLEIPGFSGFSKK
jgi:hypothetical protein